MKRIYFRVTLVCAFILLALAPSRAAHAADQVVSDCGDTGGANQLRAKLNAAQSSGGGTITFTCTGTIGLGSTLPTINSNIIVNGGNSITLSGNDATRIFSVNTGATLTLNNITLTKGLGVSGGAIFSFGTVNINHSTFLDNHAPGTTGGAIINQSGALNVTDSEFYNNTAGTGGALSLWALATITHSNFHDNAANSGLYMRGGAIFIASGANVTITNSTLSNNSANAGGGVSVWGTGGFGVQLNITNSTFSSNPASVAGGGIHIEDGAVTLTNVTLSGNSAANYGGGMYNITATVRLTDTTLSGNAVSNTGGGIYNDTGSSATLTSVTLNGNSANSAGAIYNTNAAVTLTNVTLSGNSATGTGGIVNEVNFGATVNLTNTLLAKGAMGANCAGVGGSFNLSDDNSCFFGAGRINVPNLLLGPLANNGGLTRTHMPLASSPAIDNGTNSGCPAKDQRGAARPQDGDGNTIAQCDVGAVEVVLKQNQTITFNPLPDRALSDSPFTVSATASSGLPVTFSASGVCTVSGNSVTLTGLGVCTITAHQSGDLYYNAAPDVARAFNVLVKLFLPLIVR